MALRIGLKSLADRSASAKNSLKELKWIRKKSTAGSSGGVGEVNVPSTKIVTHQPPLTHPLPGLPKAVYATAKFEENVTQVTTLPNGLRVASEPRFGQFCTVGVVVDSGSRYEVAHPSGASHFLEKLAFGATQRYPSRDSLLLALERHGGICDCQSSRDAFVYATSADSRGLETAVEALAETATRPLLADDEFEYARQSVKFDLETLRMRPEQETLLMDAIHAAAFRDNTVGLPKICPPLNADKLDRRTLINYLSVHYVPERMVVTGVGVEHERLVEYVQKHFVDKPSAWSNVDKSALAKPDTSKAQYTGGFVQEECEVPLYPGTDLPELSHVVIGLEGCSHQDDDFIAMCVLNMMMGGGGSFSAGGPGKGMYTRLYTNVLNRYHWMYNATAYNHSYADCGLFCIHASAPPPRIGETVDIIVKEMVAMAGSCPDEELRRSKTQLQSMLLMNLETRPIVFEDIARQVLATGTRRSPKYFIDAIGQITVDDIRRVAQRVLSSPPSVAARGKLRSLPTLKHIQENILSPPTIKGRLSLFR